MGKIKPVIFAVLDIASSKIACFIARIGISGEMEVIGVGQTPSSSIRSGGITNLKVASREILEAVHSAERMAEVTIENLVVNISATKVQSKIVDVELDVSGRIISDNDIEQLIDMGYANFDPEVHEIIHCIPLNYTIDEDEKVKDPRGLCGSRLQARLHLQIAPPTVLLNITNCIANCQLNVTSFISSPYAIGEACLSEEEKELGAVVVSIGSLHTSLSFFQDGHFTYSDYCLMGGLNMASDLAWGFAINTSLAASIQVKYSTLIKNHSEETNIVRIQQIPGGDEARGKEIIVTKKQISDMIRPRMDMILNEVKKKINMIGSDKSPISRVVITGGTSQMEGIEDFAAKRLGRHVRIARPKRILGVPESLAGPGYVKIHGMLFLMASQTKEMMRNNENKPFLKLKKSNSLNKVVDWVKENF